MGNIKRKSTVIARPAGPKQSPYGEISHSRTRLLRHLRCLAMTGFTSHDSRITFVFLLVLGLLKQTQELFYCQVSMLDLFLKQIGGKFFVIGNRQDRITRFRVIKNHMTSFLASEMIADFTEGLNCLTAGDISKYPHFIEPRRVCLQNIPEQVQPEYAVLFPWQHEASHEWPHEYSGARTLWFYPETCNREGLGIQQHSPCNQNRKLIQCGISFLSPPSQDIAYYEAGVKGTLNLGICKRVNYV